MKIKNIKDINITVEDFKSKQWKRGLPLSLIGVIVYATLRLFGQKPKDYYGICKYFEIGKNWGGFEMGWFFVCDKNASENLKNHEVGHGIQNAMVGGFTMVGHSICSVLRYWYRKIRNIKTPYDSWWFEGQATQLGTEFVEKQKKTMWGD